VMSVRDWIGMVPVQEYWDGGESECATCITALEQRNRYRHGLHSLENAEAGGFRDVLL